MSTVVVDCGSVSERDTWNFEKGKLTDITGTDTLAVWVMAVEVYSAERKCQVELLELWQFGIQAVKDEGVEVSNSEMQPA